MTDLELQEISRKLEERTRRFNELINGGALSHPLIPFRITRLQLALSAVAMSSDQAWDAFERYCADRDRQDLAEADA